MNGGKPAGVPCVQLTPDGRCKLYGNSERPQVCSSYRPTAEFCGASREEALMLLEDLERRTAAQEG